LSVRTPAEIHERFEEALAKSDLDTLVEIYEPDAVLVPEAGKVIEGIDGIRSHLEEMLAMTPRLQSETTVTVRSGDIAMLRAKWTMLVPAPEGEIELTGESTEVVRRQPDGTWKCVIDNPYSA
jgi:uncharacterized protein (TIGR02246 family)